MLSKLRAHRAISITKMFFMITHYDSCTCFTFQTEFLGESGLVKIDAYGDRTDFELEIRRLNEDHSLLGTWSPSSGLLWSSRQENNRQSNFEAGRPLVITTVLVMVKLLLCHPVFFNFHMLIYEVFMPYLKKGFGIFDIELLNLFIAIISE